MKRNFFFLLSVFVVVSLVSLGCASGKKAVAKEETAAVKNTNKSVAQAPTPKQSSGQESAVTKSDMKEQQMEELMKKYSTTTAQKADPEKRTAPDFKLQDINYDMYALSDYKGKQPLLLAFWIINCDYCETELQILNGRYPQLVQDGLEVFAINVGDSMNAVAAYARRFGLNIKVLSDQVTSVAGSYKVSGAPTYVLIDKDGYIVFQDNIFPDQYKTLLTAKEAAK